MNNKSRPIKQRRKKSAMSELRSIIYSVVQQDEPMTVRQVFYRLVTMGVINKTEAEYKTTVVRLLGDMRREGQIPFRWIADNTRWVRQATTHKSVHDALEWGAEYVCYSLLSKFLHEVEKSFNQALRAGHELKVPKSKERAA